jgi:segregation and condensation protein A
MDAPRDDRLIDTDGAGEGDDSPRLALEGFAGPLARLLALARAQQIDLTQLSLATVLDQLAAALQAAGHATTLGQKGDWLVMAAWLVLLRSRLLLPAETADQQEAARAARQLRDRLLALQAAQALAAWLDNRPRLGHDVFTRGLPELLGTAVEPAHQVDVIEFLWASLALFDDDPAPDTTSVYRPLLTGLYDVAAACKRILRVLAAAPDGVPLDRLLPKPPETAETEARRAMRRRSAWAGTLIAALELARQGDVALAQDGAFTRIHVRQADARAAAHDVPVAAGGERVPS